jgi:hypothetical protein
MGCIVPILRAGAGLVLSVVLFVGFGLSLVGSNVSDKLLNAEFYGDIIAAQSSYNRIYDEVLVDDELKETVTGLLGNINVVSKQETASLLRQIVPPEYLRGEVENSIDRAIAQLRQDSGSFDVYLDLTKPLESVKQVMFDYLDQKIDEAEVFESDTVYCSVDGLTYPRLSEIVDDYMTLFTSMAGGEVPVSAPDLNALPQICRQVLFSIFYERFTESRDLSPKVISSLKAQHDELKASFDSGDALNVLKVAYRPLTESLIDGAIYQMRRDLGDGHRFNLIRQLEEWYDSFSDAQVRSGVSNWKEKIFKAPNFGRVTAVIMVFGSALLMALVFLPSLSKMLIWPGIAFFITGSYFFVAGKVAGNAALEALAGLLAASPSNNLEAPLPVTQLFEDLLFAFGAAVAGGLSRPSLNLLIFGAVLIGVSLLTVLISRYRSVVE